VNKIGIVTFHKAFSYGARLQAIATQKAINKLGYNCEFIDYSNKWEVDSYKGKSLKNRIKNLLKRKDFWLKQAFEDYESFYDGNVSKQKYTDIEKMKDVKYDTLVAGSDQIWNAGITGTIDPVYLLDFGKSENRISYASSMGSHIINENELEVYRKCINRINRISVREEFAKNELKKVTQKEIEIVIDPTMLIKKEEWDGVIKSKEKRYENITKDQYILSFFVGGKVESYSKELKQVKEKLKLPIYNIQMSKIKHKNIDKPIAGATVSDFINLIKNAAFIVTDSFHGTVFSLLYQKNFLPLKNKGNPIRVKELLEYLGIGDIYNNTDNVEKHLDYNIINEKIEFKRKNSMDWLEKALKGE